EDPQRPSTTLLRPTCPSWTPRSVRTTNTDPPVRGATCYGGIKLPFGTDTQWPAAGKLPEGFSPADRLALGQDPGFGLRALQARGIDGRGVRIGIIDQPLLRDHQEYAHALERVESIGVEGVRPQMHGPAVASVAVGRHCGVAPGARLTFIALPMWKQDNADYATALRHILTLNGEARRPEDRVRVVSISYGGFRGRPDFDRWQAALQQAEGADVLVLTCDGSHRPYGTLSRRPLAPPDDPASYVAGAHTQRGAPIAVPIGYRTLAGHEAKDQYFLDPKGGRSWGAPYLAGLAALAFQVHPDLGPEQAWKLMTETARNTDAGAVPDPSSMVAAAQRVTQTPWRTSSARPSATWQPGSV
ncbi:MAG: S8/S53 family peptidase, partial [Candidatus Latescibacterota bacterium]